MTVPFRKSIVALALTTVASLALTGCSGNANDSTPASEGANNPVTIRFNWWGNDTRNTLTQNVIDLFTQQYPYITVETTTGDFNTYFDNLSTQIAAGNSPDVIQMDEKFIAQYGLDGQLLDLESINLDLSKFPSDSIDTGRIEGTLYGATFGINYPAMLMNPDVLAEAGVEPPDDTTWTWDDFAKIVGQVTQAGGGAYYGATNWMAIDGATKLWIRQNGEQQFTADGIGMSAKVLQDWFQYWLDLQNSNSITPATVSIEDSGKGIDQSLFGTGQAAFIFPWSNQVVNYTNATGSDIQILLPPTRTGKASDANMWLKSSMYLSASADTKHPEEVKLFMEFLLNNADANKVLGTERGIPANTDMRALVAAQADATNKKVIDVVDEITAENALGGPCLVPLPGGGDSVNIQKRYAESVMLGQSDIPTAVNGYMDELKKAMDL